MTPIDLAHGKGEGYVCFVWTSVVRPSFDDNGIVATYRQKLREAVNSYLCRDAC